MTVEAAYVGNRGVWEQAQGLLALNAISPSTLQKLGLDLTNAATRTLLTSSICSPAAAAAGFKLPYAAYPCSANVAQSLRPFPEYNNSLPAWFDPLGNSWYDALQMKFVRHFSRGLDLSSTFSYQKEECLGSNGCAGINDAFNRAENKGLNPLPRLSCGSRRTLTRSPNSAATSWSGKWWAVGPGEASCVMAAAT